MNSILKELQASAFDSSALKRMREGYLQFSISVVVEEEGQVSRVLFFQD